jgi:hypothetical protein
MKNEYQIFLVVGDATFELKSQSDTGSYEEVMAGMAELKDAENIVAETVHGVIIAVNGLQYKDAYFIAKKRQEDIS